jgi:hypothetical protein
MTRDEALERIEKIQDELKVLGKPWASEHATDAQRLVELLPDEMLETDRVFWINLDNGQGGIKFFWSLSANMMNPGNHITTIVTNGEGQFTVGSTSGNSIVWQRRADGTPLTNELALGQAGGREVITGLANAQLGRRDSPAGSAGVQVQDRADAVVVTGDDLRPSVAVIWDPSVVDAKTYRRLVTLLGDLTRAGGGNGVELIHSIGFGVPGRVGVPR